MPKISIILPVYNVEKYLIQCLESIINQTFTDFECICVNDGSTDNSLKILEDYAKQDDRMKIISQENKGLSAARNTGLKNVKNGYITFIDSDDWVTENYLEILYSSATKTDADIVRASYKFYYQKDDIYESAKIRKIHKINNNTDIERLTKGYAGAFVWAKLYKTSLLKNNNIYFYAGRNSEDCPFSALAYLYSKKIEFIEDEILFYRKTDKTLTSNYTKIKTDAFYNFITLTKDLINRNFNNTQIINFFIDTFIYKLGNLGKYLHKNDLKILYSTTLEHFNYLQSLSATYKCSSIYKIKIKFSLIILKIFHIYSFKIFRILKNI